MEDTPVCPNCGRPLQRKKTTCIYCGQQLSEGKIKEVENLLDEETVKSRLKKAEAMLDAQTPQKDPGKAKLIFRICISLGAAGLVVLFSWAMNWNLIFTSVLSLVVIGWLTWEFTRR